MITLEFEEGSRKKQRAVLTPAGRAFAAADIVPAMEAEGRAFGTLAECEREQLLGLIGRYTAALEAELDAMSAQDGEGETGNGGCGMRLLLRFMKPYRALTAVTLLVLLVDNVGTLLVPTMLADMINTGIGTGRFRLHRERGIRHAAASLLASGGAMTGAYLAAKLAANVARDIRNAVYDASLGVFQQRLRGVRHGSMITRTLNDTNVIQQSIIATIQLVLPVPFLAVAGIIMACVIDYQMGILLAFVVAIVLAIAVVTVTKAAPIFMSLQKLIDRMNVVLRESIVGVA